MLFAKWMRPTMLATNRSKALKMLSERWGAMTDEERRPYTDEWGRRYEKYEAELAAYRSSGKEVAWAARTGSAIAAKLALMDPERPRLPPPASSGEGAPDVAATWKAMTGAEKAAYGEEAEARREAWREEMRATGTPGGRRGGGPWSRKRWPWPRTPRRSCTRR